MTTPRQVHEQTFQRILCKLEPVKRGKPVFSATHADARGIWRKKYVYENGQHVLKVYYIGLFDGKWTEGKYAYEKYLQDKRALAERRRLGLDVALAMPDTERGDVLFGPRLDQDDPEADLLRQLGTNRDAFYGSLAYLQELYSSNEGTNGGNGGNPYDHYYGTAVRNHCTTAETKQSNSTRSRSASPTSGEDPSRLDWPGWKLPEVIRQAYQDQGIERLYPWQAECLQKPGVLTGDTNLVLSAPTSGGKTLVGEILIISRLMMGLYRSAEVQHVLALTGAGVQSAEDITRYMDDSNFNKRRVSMVIVPYVSLVTEKAEELRAKLQPLGICVEACMRGVPLSQHSLMEHVDIVVCTIEKAYILVNHFIHFRNSPCRLSLVVVDEAHLILDSARGAMLELLLAKLMYLQKDSMQCRDQQPTQKQDNPDQTLWPQIVCMSSTLPDIDKFAAWLNASIYIAPQDVRPVPLYESVFCCENAVRCSSRRLAVTREGILTKIAAQPWCGIGEFPPFIGEQVDKTALAGNSECDTDKRYISTAQSSLFPHLVTSAQTPHAEHIAFPFLLALLELVTEPMAQGLSTIVFAPTKALVECYARDLAELLQRAQNHRQALTSSNQPHPLDIQHRQKCSSRAELKKHFEALQDGSHPLLPKLCEFGIAIHHAGLTAAERQLVETGFKFGILNVLVATSTLATGVNLPARRVVICDPLTGPARLDSIRYRQMAGRAGRAGLDSQGECIVLVRSQQEFEAVKGIIHEPPKRLHSVLLQSRHVIRQAILELVHYEAASGVANLAVSGKIFDLEEAQEGSDTSGLTHNSVPAARITSLLKETLAWSLSLQRLSSSQNSEGFTSCSSPNSIVSMFKDEIRALVDLGMLEMFATPSIPSNNAPQIMLRVTHLGRLAAVSGVGAGEAVIQLKYLSKTLARFLPGSMLQVCFHAQPFDQSGQFQVQQANSTKRTSNSGMNACLVEPDWSQYAWRVMQNLPTDEVLVLENALGLDRRYLEHARLRRPSPTPEPGTLWPILEARLDNSRKLKPHEEDIFQAWLHRTIYQALIIHDLAGTQSLPAIQTRWGCDRGVLQALRHQAIFYCGTLSTLCESATWRSLAILFGTLREQLVKRVDEGIDVSTVLPHNSGNQSTLQATEVVKLPGPQIAGHEISHGADSNAIISAPLQFLANDIFANPMFAMDAAMFDPLTNPPAPIITQVPIPLHDVINPLALQYGVASGYILNSLRALGIETIESLARAGSEDDPSSVHTLAEALAQRLSYRLDQRSHGWDTVMGCISLRVNGQDLVIPAALQQVLATPFGFAAFRGLLNAIARTYRIMRIPNADGMCLIQRMLSTSEVCVALDLEANRVQHPQKKPPDFALAFETRLAMQLRTNARTLILQFLTSAREQGQCIHLVGAQGNPSVHIDPRSPPRRKRRRRGRRRKRSRPPKEGGEGLDE